MTTSAPVLLTMRIHLYCPQLERYPIGATAPTLALRLPFLTSSDMRYPYDDANWSALDRDCAANACHDIVWDDRRWNATAHCAKVDYRKSTCHRRHCWTPIERAARRLEICRPMGVSASNHEMPRQREEHANAETIQFGSPLVESCSISRIEPTSN
jgi:hypothetical protein